MKHLKKLAASSAVTIAALALAIGLLGYSTIGGARAALTYYSEDYISQMQLLEIGVTLYENGLPVATGADHQTNTVKDHTNNAGEKKGLLDTLLLQEGDKLVKADEFHLGVRYAELLEVHNPSAIDTNGQQQNINQYVRVTITRYWTDKEGEDGQKLANLDPALIQLLLDGVDIAADEGEGALYARGWLVDPEASTDERMVLYYSEPVGPGDKTSPFADTFMVSGDAAKVIDEKTVSDDQNGVTVEHVYRYNNANFHLDIRVDAVQDHHAADAIQSAWGRTVTIDEAGKLSIQ